MYLEHKLWHFTKNGGFSGCLSVLHFSLLAYRLGYFWKNSSLYWENSNLSLISDQEEYNTVHLYF